MYRVYKTNYIFLPLSLFSFMKSCIGGDVYMDISFEEFRNIMVELVRKHYVKLILANMKYLNEECAKRFFINSNMREWFMNDVIEEMFIMRDRYLEVIRGGR